MENSEIINKIYFTCFSLAFVVLLADAYLQFAHTLQPCSIVYIERITLFLLGLIFLTASLYHHTVTSNRVAAITVLILSLFGSLTALRHIWLQNFTSGTAIVPNPANYTSQFTYIFQWIQTAYAGTAQCSQVLWQIAGISLSIWMCTLYTLFAVCALFLLRYRY